MKRSRSNTLRIAITVLLAAVLLASLAMPALAADNEDSPTWGVNMQRTRCIDSGDNIYQNYVTYNSTAQYCQLDSNLQSFSTPTCYTDSSGMRWCRLTVRKERTATFMGCRSRTMPSAPYGAVRLRSLRRVHMRQRAQRALPQTQTMATRQWA